MFESVYAYSSMFVTAFLASTILPLGSETLFAYLAHSGHNLILLILVASIGNFIGSLVNYYVGMLGQKTILSRYIKIDNRQFKRSKDLFNRYGNPILFFSWVPVIGDALTLFAGVAGSDLKKFYVYVFFGKLARYLVIALFFL
ncbi:MAG: DedA family protein [Candidatus Aenigmarchaeota archaeon]|nr:DedA family protein [Candidatus Aenigmarchaeota archaeon]